MRDFGGWPAAFRTRRAFDGLYHAVFFSLTLERIGRRDERSVRLLQTENSHFCAVSLEALCLFRRALQKKL